MEATVLSPDKIKALDDLDFQIQKVQVDTIFEYETEFRKVNERTKEYIEEEVSSCAWSALCTAKEIPVYMEKVCLIH